MGQKHTSVFLALINNDNEVFTVRRSAAVNNAGQWGLPGGRQNDGETLVDTAFREVKEETGLTLNSSLHGRLHIRQGGLNVIAIPWTPSMHLAREMNFLLNGRYPSSNEIDDASWWPWTDAIELPEIHKSLDLFLQKVPLYSMNLFDILEERPIL